MVPRIGYHIDPFGHAASIPLLFSALGYDAFVGNRIDFRYIYMCVYFMCANIWGLRTLTNNYIYIYIVCTAK